MNDKERLALMMILITLLASCATKEQVPYSSMPPLPQASPESSAPDITVSKPDEPAVKNLREDKSYLFLERSIDATDGGMARLIDKMTAEGLSFYQTAQTPSGLIAYDDVVFLKINCQ